MADDERTGDNSGGVEIQEFSCKKTSEKIALECRRNGLSAKCSCAKESGVCLAVSCEKLASKRLGMNGMNNNYQGSNCCGGGVDAAAAAACCNVSSSLGLVDLEEEDEEEDEDDEEEEEDGSISPMDCNRNRNKRRTLRFDSSESSDSGVAALSNTESSQSSGTSDITEPCSPPSPVSPPSCTHSQSDGDHLNGYDATSPPSCQGSYDSGLEEVTASQSPPTPGQSSDDHGLEKEEESPCPATEEDESYHEDQHDDAYATTRLRDGIDVAGLQSGADADRFRENVRDATAATAVDCCARFLQQPQSAADSGAPTPAHDDDEEEEEEETSCHADSEATSWSHSNSHVPWQAGPTSAISERDGGAATVAAAAVVDVKKVKVECAEGCSSKQRHHLAPESDPLLMCRWTNCRQVLPGGGDMIDHIRSCHVDAQVNSESFVCLWEGCKVYSKASCSLSWLERHVLTHSGNKPFKCIVDGCGQRFTSQNGLERHVNSHFNQPQHHNGNLHKRKDDTPTKIMKKKRLRYRRTCWTARTEDFFDAGIMECLRHRLVMFSSHTRLDIEGSSNSITFHGTVIARQVENSGKAKVLLHWVPENVIPDEWVCESQVVSRLKQTIPLSRLPRDAMAGFESLSSPVSRPYRKNRRK